MKITYNIYKKAYNLVRIFTAKYSRGNMQILNNLLDFGGDIYSKILKREHTNPK